MRSKTVCVLRFLVLILFISFSKISFGADEKELIENKIQKLNNIPISALKDSVEDIIYYLHHFESSYGVSVLETVDSLLPSQAVSAKIIAKHYLYEFDTEHQYERIDSAHRYAISHKHYEYDLDYLVTKANLFYFDQNYDSAMVAILMARKITNSSDKQKEIEILHLLGDVFFALELYSSAEEYYNKANTLVINPSKHNAWRPRVINNNLGLIKIEKGDYEGAKRAFQDPINRLDQRPVNYDDSLRISYSYRKISYCLINMDSKLDSALIFTRFSLDFSKKHQLTVHLFPSYQNIIRIFIKTDHPDSVRHYLSEYSKQFPFEELSLDAQMEDLLLKSEISEYFGDTAQALDDYKKYLTLHNSTHLNQKAAGIIKMLTDQEYGELKSNYTEVNNQRRILMIAIIIVSILVVVILLFALKTWQLNKKLLKSNQTKDKLFSIISHDLRSPFNSIIGFNDLIAESIERKQYEEVKTYNNIVIESSNSLISLIDNLLVWSKSQQNNLELEPASVGVNELIQDAVTFAELQAKRKSVLIKVIKTDNLKCYIDRPTISIVLNNLISNALKFSYPDNEISVEASQHGHHIQISISDNGTGIPKEKLKHLFEVSRSKSTRGTQNENGNGLGLVICKEFIDKNKGTIKVESELNAGTTFIISLPVD